MTDKQVFEALCVQGGKDTLSVAELEKLLIRFDSNDDLLLKLLGMYYISDYIFYELSEKERLKAASLRVLADMNKKYGDFLTK